MDTIQTTEALEALYGPAVPGALTKVKNVLTPLYQRWVNASRFVVLTTVGRSGTDASPRGDTGPVARIFSEREVWIPDWRGNNRLDSLRNIVEDGRVSLMFMINGVNNVVRINGSATLTADDEIVTQFEKNGKTPRTVIVVTVQEAYFQCAKALMRSKLWHTDPERVSVPTAGEFLREVDAGFDAESYDSGYSAYAEERMW